MWLTVMRKLKHVSISTGANLATVTVEKCKLALIKGLRGVEILRVLVRVLAVGLLEPWSNNQVNIIIYYVINLPGQRMG